MTTSLQALLADFYKVDPTTIHAAAILSDDAYDGVLDVFESLTNTKVERCDALDGIGYLTNHPDFPRQGLIDEEKKYTAEEVALTLSYIDLFRECIDRDVEVLLAVSEAAIPTIPKAAFLGAVEKFLKEIEFLESKFAMPKMRDILLFGSAAPQGVPIGKYVKVVAKVIGPVPFFCITREAMRRCVALHTIAVRKGRLASIEELMSVYLEAERKQALTPFQDTFFAQIATEDALEKLKPVVPVVDEESDDESD
jgi:hypothetical protein